MKDSVSESVNDSVSEAAALYVYYKVDAAQHANCARQVRRFQARLLAAWPGLVCELLQRPDAAGGVETWMEAYRHADGVSAALITHIAEAAEAAVADGLPTPRHCERFVALR